MAKHIFRLYAVNDTQYWNFPDDHPLKGVTAWSVYLFEEGVGTYCCSLTPSSWCEFIENRFEIDISDLDYDHPAMRALEEFEYEGQDNYYEFVRLPEKARFVSDPCEVEIDDEDEDEHHTEAWEEAREYFRGNYACIPAVDGLPNDLTMNPSLVA